jgi:hypothetical protein
VTRPFISRNGVIAGVGVVVVIVALAFFTAPNRSKPVDDGDPWTGRWLINGVSAQDTEYSGSLTILGVPGGYELQWLVTGDIALGQGRLVGDRLEVTWESTAAITGRQTGSASYFLEADGTISGTRSIAGVAGTGSEKGEPAR